MKNITLHGFTLIETMIAVSILSLSVAGPLYTASRAIVAAEISRDQLTASYLAQEAAEYVRALRDDQYLAQYPPAAGSSATAWNNFKSSLTIASCTAPNICTLGLPLASQPSVLPFAQCPGGTCTVSFTLGTSATAYTRTFQATAVGANEEKIVSTVWWSFHGTQYSVTISDHLTPWQ